MKIFGHRGAAGLVAENTLESVKEALHFKVDGIEIDIHQCRSGELVVIHDETLERTTNGKGEVSDFTLQELRQFSTEEGFLIPTLQEVLALIDGRSELNIELKGKHTALPTLQLLDEYISNSNWQNADFILSSFDHQQLRQLRTVTSKYRIGVLTEESIAVALPIAKELEAFSVHPPIRNLTEQEVTLAKDEGFKVFVWTVNDISLIRKSKSWNVDGVITDFPNFAL